MGFESRLKFNNPEVVWGKIEGKISVKEEYESEDFLFQPKGKNWDIRLQNMRLRVGIKGPLENTATLIYRENEWKDGIHEEKVGLMIPISNKDQGLAILESWNFEKIVNYKKVGKAIAVPGRKDGFVWEEIEHLGVLVEIPGESAADVEELTNKIFEKADYEIVEKLVPEMVVEKINGNTN